MSRRLATFSWVVLPVLLALPGIIRADTPIFKYEDDSGTVTFTEQWDSIPQKYRGQVVTLNGLTLKPIQTVSSPPAAQALQPIVVKQSHDSVLDSWRDWLYGLSLSLPSQFQLGLGLISGVVIAGVLIVRRYMSNPFMKVFLKFVIVILLGGTAYVFYFLDLNADHSTSAREAVQPAATVDGLVETLKITSAPISKTIQHNVLHPLQSAMQQSKDATLGQATRAANQANTVTTQIEKSVKDLETEEAHAGGQ